MVIEKSAAGSCLPVSMYTENIPTIFMKRVARCFEMQRVALKSLQRVALKSLQRDSLLSDINFRTKVAYCVVRKLCHKELEVLCQFDWMDEKPRRSRNLLELFQLEQWLAVDQERDCEFADHQSPTWNNSSTRLIILILDNDTWFDKHLKLNQTFTMVYVHWIQRWWSLNLL